MVVVAFVRSVLPARVVEASEAEEVAVSVPTVAEYPVSEAIVAVVMFATVATRFEINEEMKDAKLAARPFVVLVAVTVVEPKVPCPAARLVLVRFVEEAFVAKEFVVVALVVTVFVANAFVLVAFVVVPLVAVKFVVLMLVVLKLVVERFVVVAFVTTALTAN